MLPEELSSSSRLSEELSSFSSSLHPSSSEHNANHHWALKGARPLSSSIGNSPPSSSSRADRGSAALELLPRQRTPRGRAASTVSSSTIWWLIIFFKDVLMLQTLICYVRNVEFLCCGCCFWMLPWLSDAKMSHWTMRKNNLFQLFFCFISSRGYSTSSTTEVIRSIK